MRFFALIWWFAVENSLGYKRDFRKIVTLEANWVDYLGLQR